MVAPRPSDRSVVTHALRSLSERKPNEIILLVADGYWPRDFAVGGS
jgi:hypothetical protein